MNKENVAKVQFHSFGSFKGWPVWNFFHKFLICWVWKNEDWFRLWQFFFEYLQISSEVYSCCHTLLVVYISLYRACTSTSVMQTPSLPSSTDQVVATLNRIWISPGGPCASNWRAQPWREITPLANLCRSPLSVNPFAWGKNCSVVCKKYCSDTRLKYARENHPPNILIPSTGHILRACHHPQDVQLHSGHIESFWSPFVSVGVGVQWIYIWSAFISASTLALK